VESVVSITPEAVESPAIPEVSREPEGRYEVVCGKIVEKPPIGVFETWIASELFGWLKIAEGLRDHGRSVSEMIFMLDAAVDLKRRPDLAFVTYERWAKNRPVPRTSVWDVIPDLAIEVISPTNGARDVIVKVGEYFRHGVKKVWIVYPLEEQVYVYHSPTSIRVLTRSDRLESPEILPGFQLPLEQLFESESPAE
jgi:Uma2 family endonuclease